MKKLTFFVTFLLITSICYAQYVSKTPKIYVTELTVADTWYEVLAASRCTAIRGYKIKARYDGTSAPSAFDISFTENPNTNTTGAGDGYYSNTGVGSGDESSPANGIYSRSATAGTIIEVIAYE